MWNFKDFLRTWVFKESLSVQVDNLNYTPMPSILFSCKNYIDTLANFYRKETDHFHSSIIHSVVDSQYSANPLLYMKCPDLHRFSMRQTWILFKVTIKVIIQSNYQIQTIDSLKIIVYGNLFWLYFQGRIIYIYIWIISRMMNYLKDKLLRFAAFSGRLSSQKNENIIKDFLI